MNAKQTFMLIETKRMTKSYSQSLSCLKRAEKTIPLGSQTFSKSKLAYPLGVSPLFINKGQGCQVWDVDDNQYTDFVSGLLSISLGYCDEDVDNAVIKQMKSGVSFSLPHTLEMEVAELLVDMIPCAEMVRFGKNGSDATSAAIRLARAHTKRDHVAVCGYHGWQDWYIGSTTRDLGVPNSVKELTHKFIYNDIASLEDVFKEYPDKISAVILEPMNTTYPENNFLQHVKDICKQHGAVLIFDETITGFRYSQGGAQQLFEVMPDLATFGKGMANGFPVSAVVGSKSIMMLMEDIFFSSTFAGETLSLAATKATLTKIKNQGVLEHIHAIGEKLLKGLTTVIDKYNAQLWLTLTGHPSWSFLVIKDHGNYTQLQLKSLLLQEMSKRGILLGGGHNLSFAHKEQDIEKLLTAYEEVIAILIDTIAKQDFNERFHGELLEPVFKVR
jgi:glutamate-1-semialdehyde 2,1-aminomutase